MTFLSIHPARHANPSTMMKWRSFHTTISYALAWFDIRIQELMVFSLSQPFTLSRERKKEKVDSLCISLSSSTCAYCFFFFFRSVSIKTADQGKKNPSVTKLFQTSSNITHKLCEHVTLVEPAILQLQGGKKINFLFLIYYSNKGLHLSSVECDI